ncbi:hypothetical protein AS149_13975 [Burkholderia cenocepacia]|nr:hypothetical protein AS149_13975 [Burkholderia cenocepacia]
MADAYRVTTAFFANRRTKETNLGELALKHSGNRDFVEVALESLNPNGRIRKLALAYHQTGKIAAHRSRRVVKALIDNKRSPRWTMQLWGTEYRRKSKYGIDSYWLDQVAALIKAHPNQDFVITDVRFRNEAVFVGILGGQLVRVSRPVLEALEAAERAKNGTAAHASETELLGYPVQHTVLNEEGKLMNLRSTVLAIAAVPEYQKAA